MQDDRAIVYGPADPERLRPQFRGASRLQRPGRDREKQEIVWNARPVHAFDLLRLSFRQMAESSWRHRLAGTRHSRPEPWQAACELRWRLLEISVPEKKRGQFGTRPFKLTAVRVAEEFDPFDGESGAR